MVCDDCKDVKTILEEIFLESVLEGENELGEKSKEQRADKKEKL